MTLVYVNNDDALSGLSGGRRRRLTVPSHVRLGEAGVQGGVISPAPQDCLARRELAAEEQAAVWWLGAHGGSGESTLEELFAGSRAAGHAWPLSPVGEPAARVVLIARTHANGLQAAQRAVRQWAAGDVPVLLLGLVLIADAPGRLPHPLRQLAGLVAGGVPAVWSLPWVEAWRIGNSPGPSNAPKAARRLLEDLRAMTETAAAGTRNVNRKDEE